MSGMTSAGSRSETPSLIDKLDDITQTPLAEFDAFPKLPSTYKARSESRGFLTIFVTFLAFLLVLNDLGEYIWGWPDYEFSVDRETANNMNVNVDMVVNMPCQCKSSYFVYLHSFAVPQLALVPIILANISIAVAELPRKNSHLGVWA